MNNSEFSGEPQVFPLIQALFVDNDWTCLESLLDENIQWHATEPRRDYSGLSQVRDHIESQMHRHRETLICTTAPVSSALNDRYRLITVKALMQGKDCHSLILTLIQDQESGKFCFVQICPAQIASEAYQNQELALTFLPDQMPGGIFHCLFDEPLTLLQTSDSFLQLTGYTREEIRTELHNSFRALIDPRDYENTLREVREQLRHGCDKELQFRLLRKNAEPIWVLDKGRYLQDEWGRQYFCCILVDISESKRIAEEFRLSLQRYEIIMNQTQDIIFEWNIATDELTFSENWKQYLGYPRQITVSGLLDEKNTNFYPEQRSLFADLCRRIRAGQAYIEDELQLHDVHHQPNWFRIRVTTQLDENQKPIKAIGILSNIDEDKQRAQKLLEKAQRDPLTQYYNKETAQILIQDWLSTQPAQNALMIIDIDDFKIVNDTLGHLFGDAFLIEATSRIRQLFRSEDILGRVGGDEFLVFMKNIPDKELAEKKARQIIEAFQSIEFHNQKILKVSCSIGIAMTSPVNPNFHYWFHRADQALYSMKSQGKNQYAFYNQLADNDAFFPMVEGASAVNARIDSNLLKKYETPRISEFIFSKLYEAQDLERCIQEILEIIGRHFDVSRVYIFENSDDDQYCTNTFEWCNEGIPPEKENLQHISYEDDLEGRYLANFDENGLFYCQDIQSLDPAQVRLLEPQKIKSLLQCLIQDRGRPRGYIGFDECREKRLWDQEQINVLTYVAEILSVFLLKKRAEDRIQQLESSLKVK